MSGNANETFICRQRSYVLNIKENIVKHFSDWISVQKGLSVVYLRNQYIHKILN